MGILYNANLTPAMNDNSVTSGNADGWVYADGERRAASAERAHGETANGGPKRRKARDDVPTTE
jgi:hypothetical protein